MHFPLYLCTIESNCLSVIKVINIKNKNKLNLKFRYLITIARRSNQSILKEISPGCSLERMMLKLKHMLLPQRGPLALGGDFCCLDLRNLFAFFTVSAVYVNKGLLWCHNSQMMGSNYTSVVL